jgi:hypothetical protein
MKACCLKLTVVRRNGFCLAFTVLGGAHIGSDWSVLDLIPRDGPRHRGKRRPYREAAGGDLSEQPGRLNFRGEEMVTDVRLYGAAVAMAIGEIINPGDTRNVLWLELDRLGQRPFDPNRPVPWHRRHLLADQRFGKWTLCLRILSMRVAQNVLDRLDYLNRSDIFRKKGAHSREPYFS